MSQTPTVNNRFVPPDIAEFFMRRMRDISAGINCCLIGEVLEVQYVNQYPTVRVAVNFQKVIKGVIPLSGNIGEMADSVTNYPDLVSVPLFIYQGGGAALTMPVRGRVTSGGQITQRGDMCLIFFCDRDMDIWFQTGQLAPPNSERVHNINDAIAFVGINTLVTTIVNYDPNIASLSDKTGERLAQAGFLQPYAGSTVPSGWLLCYGQAVNRTTYANLFSKIGTIYGAGNGSTTFNIPDLRGRTVAGLDNMGGTNANVLTVAITPNRNTLGGETGQETVNLLHNHTGNSGGVIFGSSPEGFPGSTTAGALDTLHYHPIANDLSTTQTVMQPTMLINWLIKI